MTDGTDRGYKRGAIMGLTVAEAFILLSFCLLLLFTWWQVEVEHSSLPVPQDVMRMTEEEKKNITSLLQDGSFQLLLEMRNAGLSASDAAVKESAKEMSRFMSDEELRRLMKGAAELPADTLLTLSDIIEIGDNAALVEVMNLIQESNLITDEDMRRLMKNATELPPETLLALSQVLEFEDKEIITDALNEILEAQVSSDDPLSSIAGRIAAAAEAEGALYTALENALGEKIRLAGGSLDPDGTISLPQSLLFDVNNDQIRNPEFLKQFCPIWLKTMRASGVAISELKIEGHASSEGPQGSSADASYLYNLDLSQRRAHNVLTMCLNGLNETEAQTWSRQHLIAVGYSSSRPIQSNIGQEDREKSRRVMFSVNIDREGLLEEIGSDISNVN